MIILNYINNITFLLTKTTNLLLFSAITTIMFASSFATNDVFAANDDLPNGQPFQEIDQRLTSLEDSAADVDSFFDVFFRDTTAGFDSFFDIFDDSSSTVDSFFDVFIELDARDQQFDTEIVALQLSGQQQKDDLEQEIQDRQAADDALQASIDAIGEHTPATDIDPTNELQTLSLSGNTLSLSNGGGSVDLPSSSGVSLLGPVTFTSSAGGTGGSSFSLSCPDGFIAQGLVGRSGDDIDKTAVVCTQLEGLGLFGPVLGSSTTTSSIGGDGGTDYGTALQCDSGSAMIGVFGIEGTVFFDGGGSAFIVDQLGVKCKSLSDGSVIDKGPVATVEAPSPTPFELLCPTGKVATGIDGRQGLLMDSIRVQCR